MTPSSNSKKAYQAPKLKRYGDMAKLTATGASGSLEGTSPAASKRT